MSDRLKGKSIIITGGESGIGRAIALRCLDEGASVVISGISEEDMESTYSEAIKKGMDERVQNLITDVTEPDQVQKAIDFTLKKFGRLDAAIANAGAFCSSTPFGEWSVDEMERLVSVNLTGVFYLLHSAAKVLVSQGEGGSLLATGSSTGIRPIPNLIPYTSTKGGVHQMMRGSAVELAPYKIKVITIVPGMAETRPVVSRQGYVEAGLKMVPMNEIVQPDELAAFVALSLSDEIPHITGTLLKVDAGRTSA